MPVEYEDVTHQIKRLDALERGSGPVVRSGVNAYLKVTTKGIVSEANIYDHGSPHSRVVNGHVIDPGGLGASIGSRLKKGSGQIEGKSGLGVGKSPTPIGTQVVKGGRVAVRYGHLVILGTKPRFTGSKRVWTKKLKRHIQKDTGNEIQFRGSVTEHLFVERGHQKVKAQAEEACFATIEKGLREIEAAAL